MKLISLGIANIPGPGRLAGAGRPALEEIGATGTPIMSGLLRDPGEYNADLVGMAGYQTFEKMRRSDGQVAATLAAIKLPIRSAHWTVRAPEDATPAETEATDFARECFLEELDLDAAIRNALLMLDFGVAAHEDVWYVDGNRYRLRKLAPRLPITFYRWLTKPGTDELAALEQQGWRGETFVMSASIPVEQLAIFTFEMEGANFAGRSLLRPMYKHWYMKDGMYRVDAIAQERNGMGVPFVKMGANASKEDRAIARGWVQALAAHEKAGIVLPGPDWDFGLKGVEGTTRDPKDSITHHNLQISMAALEMFLTLGQTQTGARALGETMSDFFSMSVQATANQIAKTITQTSLKRLIDYNDFGGPVERYPQLVPAEILSIKFDSIVGALKDLASAGVDAVQPDDEMESWLRRLMGAPEKGTARKRPAPAGPAAPAAPAAPAPEAKVAASEAGGVRVWREPKPVERCLALSEIVGALDKGRDEIAGAMRRARGRVTAEIVQKLFAAPVAQMHRVSIEPDGKLTAEIETTLSGLYDFGVAQVGAELQRQRSGAAPADAATVRQAVVAAARGKRDPLGVYADAAVSEFENGITARAVNVALDWRRRPGEMTVGEQIQRVQEELDKQSDKWVDGVASKGANEAFADGRADGYEQHADEIGSVIYSALLDINCCENCLAADGAEGATPDDIPDAPNPDCDGGDKCRCVHVFVFSDEVKR